MRRYRPRNPLRETARRYAPKPPPGYKLKWNGTAYVPVPKTPAERIRNVRR